MRLPSALILTVSLVFIGLALPAHAADDISYSTIFGSKHGDAYSSLFLNQIFGDLFPAANGTSSGDVFSSIVGIFNLLVLVVAGLMFFYNITVGVLQSAHEGQVLGQRWSSLWAPLRVIFAVGMLVPVPSTGGYNLAQMGVAYIVKGSTNIATTVWNSAATLILADGIPITSSNGAIDADMIIRMYENAACVQVADYQLGKVNEDVSVGYFDMSTVAPPASFEMSGGRVTYNATGVDDDFLEDYILLRDRQDGQVTAVYNSDTGKYSSIGICGEWRTPEIPDFLQNIENDVLRGDDPDAATYVSELITLFRDRHAENMKEINDEILDQLSEDGHDAAPVLKDVFSGEAEDLPIITADIEAMILKANSNLTSVYADVRVKAMEEGGVNSAKDRLLAHINGTCIADETGDAAAARCYGEGWLGAGSWYITMARVNGELASLMTAVPTVSSQEFVSYREDAYTAAGGTQSGGGRFWHLFKTHATDEDLSTNIPLEEFNRLSTRYATMIDESTRGLTILGFGIDADDVGAIGQEDPADSDNWIKLVKVQRAAEAIMRYMIEYIDPGRNGQDPMVGMLELGRQMVEAGFGLIIAGGLAATLSPTIAAFVVTFASVLFSAGGTMAILVPFLPFFYWILAATGYFLLVIEAIVAVNLFALSHMRLDGEGFSGPGGERGWILLLSLLMTPVLMIFGFIVGMIIFRVTSSLLGAGIVYAASGIAGTSAAITVVSAVAFPIMIVVMNVMILERSFSLVSEFPAKVLSWIGGDTFRDQGEGRARTSAVAAVAAINHGVNQIEGHAVAAGSKAGAPVRKGLKNVFSNKNPGKMK